MHCLVCKQNSQTPMMPNQMMLEQATNPFLDIVPLPMLYVLSSRCPLCQIFNQPQQSSNTSPNPGNSIVKTFDLFSFGRIAVVRRKALCQPLFLIFTSIPHHTTPGKSRPQTTSHPNKTSLKRREREGVQPPPPNFLREREGGLSEKLTSVLELPRFIILGHPSLSFSRRVHSKQ